MSHDEFQAGQRGILEKVNRIFCDVGKTVDHCAWGRKFQDTADQLLGHGFYRPGRVLHPLEFSVEGKAHTLNFNEEEIEDFPASGFGDIIKSKLHLILTG